MPPTIFQYLLRSPRANYPNDCGGGRDGSPGLDKTIDFNWTILSVCIVVGEWVWQRERGQWERGKGKGEMGGEG